MEEKIFCEHCGAELKPGSVVWLTFDQRNGRYTDQPIPEEFSQGGFPFGKDCAKTILSTTS